jgi:hypothetical protein
MAASAHSQFLPRLVGANLIDWGGGVQAPALQPALRITGSGEAPCLVSQASEQTLHLAWLDIPAPEHAFYTSRTMPKLIIITRGYGTADNTLVRAVYQIEVVRPYIFTPTTGPNGSTGSLTLNDDAEIYAIGLSATDAHAADGSDWTDIKATTITLAAPTSGDLDSTLNRGEVLLKVRLPYMPGSNNIAFGIFGLGWSG